MKFLTSAIAGFLYTSSSVIAQSISEKEPIFHTATGSAVYNTPSSGGTIQIKVASSIPVFHDVDLPDSDDEEQATIVSESEVDLSQLSNLESDIIEIDLGEGLIQFVRDHRTNTNVDPTNASSINRRKLRRIQEIAEDSVEDIVECFLSNTCTNQHTDILPPNGFFDEKDPTQTFQYFEGKAIFQNHEASAYVKRLIHPNTGSAYLSGILVTERYEYVFRGDPVTGKTFMTQLDPDKFPGMPDPIDPREEEEMEEEIMAGGTRKTRRELLDEEAKEVERLKEEEMKRKRRLGGDQQQRQLQTDDGSVLDIMVAYTKSAMCQANNQAYPCDDINPAQHLAIINVAEQAVARTNEAYINSNIDTQLRLVYVHYTPYDDRSDSCGSVLGAVRKNGDGLMDEVHGLRNTWGADFVALLTSTSAGTCGGIAYVGPYNAYMFSVTKWRYAVGGTFAHEVGHNFGCQHDRLNSSPGHPYQYGWQDPEGEFRTIMAYNCPNKYCPRINYFSNPTERYNGKIMGNAINDCARKHNEGLQTIALYRSARLTNSPTMSLAPSTSLVPSGTPTEAPTGKPSLSLVPSGTPSMSSEPSGAPSEYPTFNIASLDEFTRIQSPGTTAFQVQHGLMFDIEAKDYDVTIHNFRIPFLRAAESVKISIWVHDGPFWYEKNNVDAWTWVGSPDAYSPGVTLEDPVPLPLRGGTEYGFVPIIIEAGSKKGIYILVNETSLEDNLIGMDTRSATSCSIDALAPFSFPTWFENDRLAISQGVFKEEWMSSVGSALDSFNFIGSIYYTTDEPMPSDTPSKSEIPSLAPSLSMIPSSSPSQFRSGSPSISQSPSTSLSPSLQPSNSLVLEAASPQAITVAAVDGLMFDVQAKDRDILITSFKIVIYSVSPENANDEVDLALFSHSSSFLDETLGDGYDRDTWIHHGTTKVTASSTLEPTPIPENSFEPIFVKQGLSVGLFLTIMDPQRNHKLLARLGNTLMSNDLENTHLLAKQGAALQWQPCDAWGITLTETNGSPTPHGFLGSILYRDMTGSDLVPSAMPSGAPTLSLAPSNSFVPSSKPSDSFSPSLAHSLTPSSSMIPSYTPSKSDQPTYETVSLRTSNGSSNDDGSNDGSSGSGLMFDIIAKRPVEIRSFTLSSLQSYPMDIIVFSRKGSHYYAYDAPNEWEAVASFTNWTGGDSEKLSIPEVSLTVNASIAFYIAIVDTHGESSPILGGFLPGQNYRDGVWASDDYIQIMEGVKFFGIDKVWPFGRGTAESGVYMLEGPGGISFNMKDSVIEYRVIDTIMPSTAPSLSQVPSLSTSPSLSPSESFKPSSSPSESFKPSNYPSISPSKSKIPSLQPSAAPSAQPSESAMPSYWPSVSSMPSSSPSTLPSGMPSESPSSAPSTSSQPSDSPSSSPSLSPSVSHLPSYSPSISLMPSMDRMSLVSTSPGSVTAAYGVMFEVKAFRAVTVETFAVKRFLSSDAFHFHIFTKPGSLDSSSWNTANAWTKLGEAHFSSVNADPIRLPSNNLDSVQINTGQTQSFYIACVGNYFRVHSASAGDESSNGEVTIRAGLRKYPYDNLFQNANQQTYLFQGELIYSYAIEPPSISPSDFPSLPPSISFSPTSRSGTPSTSPSSSSAPSTSPTNKPTTLSPTRDPFKEARIEITIPASITLSGFNMPSSNVEMATVVTILAGNVKEALSKNLNTSQRVKSVRIISINGVAVTGGFSLRRLSQSRELSVAAVEYEALLEEICASTGCSDADAVAVALYDRATDAMKEEIDSGNFASAVQSDATSASISALLAVAVDSSDFSQVVLTLLGVLSIFYPDWEDRSAYCSNDGNQPVYMDRQPDLWLTDSREECCKRYYSYAYNECMGISALAIGWYPAWAHNDNEAKCINDNEIPDYMRNDPGSWVYPDASSCCAEYYAYELSNCFTASGVSLAAADYKFYPAWAVGSGDAKCINGTEYPGYMKTSSQVWLFDDLVDCCENYYDYAGRDCVVDSGGSVSNIATNKWYVQYKDEVCVKDCDDVNDTQCGGLAKLWDELFDDSAGCCSKKLHWVKKSECTA